MTVAELITLLGHLDPTAEVAVLGRYGVGIRFVGLDPVPGGVYLLSEESSAEPFNVIGSNVAPKLR